MGYFPAENPQYSCIVVVYAPTGGIYGNIVAGPIFREIADKIYATDFDLQDKEFPKTPENISVPVSREGFYADTRQVFDYFDIPVKYKNPDAVWIRTKTLTDTIIVEKLSIYDHLVPNVKGMGAMDAIYLIENAGMTVEIEGAGVVKQMSVQPGTPILKGAKVKLTLGKV